MDRSLIAIALLSLLSVGCTGDDATSDSVFKKSESPECIDSLAVGRYIVNWADGRQTIEYAANDEEFKSQFLEQNLDEITFAEPDYKIRVQPASDFISTSRLAEGAPPTSFDNWGIEQTGADVAWQQGTRGEGVIVAVIDSGVDTLHDQLAAQIYTNPGETGLDDNGVDKSKNNIDDDGNGYVDDYSGWDFLNNSNHVYDDSGHGTHVAGIIAAEHNDTALNTEHVQGMAPGAKILPLDFLDGSGGLISSGVEAIKYASAMGAKIINASWGGPGCSVSLEAAIAQLTNQGVLFISAAGNEGTNIDRYKRYPASHNLVNQINVGSVSKPETDGSVYMAGHSNNGDQSVHLFAPGFEIISTVPYGGFEAFSGTSMATPFVAGAAALLWSKFPEKTYVEIKKLILDAVTTDETYHNITNGRLYLPKVL